MAGGNRCAVVDIQIRLDRATTAQRSAAIQIKRTAADDTAGVLDRQRIGDRQRGIDIDRAGQVDLVRDHARKVDRFAVLDDQCRADGVGRAFVGEGAKDRVGINTAPEDDETVCSKNVERRVGGVQQIAFNKIDRGVGRDRDGRCAATEVECAAVGHDPTLVDAEVSAGEVVGSGVVDGKRLNGHVRDGVVELPGIDHQLIDAKDCGAREVVGAAVDGERVGVVCAVGLVVGSSEVAECGGVRSAGLGDGAGPGGNEVGKAAGADGAACDVELPAGV